MRPRSVSSTYDVQLMKMTTRLITDQIWANTLTDTVAKYSERNKQY